MPFMLKAYCNYDWVALAQETFADFREARARAAALLLAGRWEMVALCRPPAGEGGKALIVACLTSCEPRGARPTEWPGVWEWAPGTPGRPAPAA